MFPRSLFQSRILSSCLYLKSSYGGLGPRFEKFKSFSTSKENQLELIKIPNKIQSYQQQPLETWGLHLTIDASHCNPNSIRSKNTISKFTKELVQKIDMKAFGHPQIVMFGDGNKKGYTLVQLIETSNICAHFCEENNSMYFDLFSCKYFSQKAVEKIVYDYFQPVSFNTLLRKRDSSLTSF
jgi:S-adenosylmethionine/arginine decarboxylase-like enzyme